MHGKGKLLEHDSDLVAVLGQKLLLQEFVEARAGRTLEVGVLHDRHRGARRAHAGLVPGHDQALNIVIVLKRQDVSQDADLRVPREPHLSRLLVGSQARGEGRSQKLGERGLGKGPDRQLCAGRKLGCQAHVALDLSLRLCGYPEEVAQDDVMTVLRDEDIARASLLAVVARYNGLKEAGERRFVQRLSRQFHRLGDAEVLANILDNLIRADLAFRRAGARALSFRDQRDPAGYHQQQNRKALANLDVQWMGLLSRWMETATPALETALHYLPVNHLPYPILTNPVRKINSAL